MTEAKVFVLTIVVVGILLIYVYWQNRIHAGGWMPNEAREQLNRERRVPPRVPCVTSITIVANGRTISGVSHDIAIGGMLLKPLALLSVGEPVQVSFDLPNGPHIDFPGAICRKQGEYVAVKFDVMTQQRSLIQKWVDQQQSSSTTPPLPAPGHSKLSPDS